MDGLEREWYIRNPEVEQRPYPLIVIFGAQGVGKTTLRDLLLANLPGAIPHREPWEEISIRLNELNGLKRKIFLGQASLAEKNRAAILSRRIEFHFLRDHYRGAPGVRGNLDRGPVVADTSKWTDPLYMEIYREFGVTSQENYEAYVRRFRRVLPLIPSPNIILGLMVSQDKLVARWEKRKRQLADRGVIEAGLPEAHIRRMAGIGNSFISFAQASGWPIVPIDTDKWDYANNDIHRQEVMTMVVSQAKTRFGISLTQKQ